MHSSKFTKVAQQADERSQVIVALVEDVAANAESQSVTGAVIMHNADTGEFTFARVTVGPRGAVTFEGEQNVRRNVSKAYKYLADYTMDRRPLVHLESGVEVERGTEGVAA